MVKRLLWILGMLFLCNIYCFVKIVELRKLFNEQRIEHYMYKQKVENDFLRNCILTNFDISINKELINNIFQDKGQKYLLTYRYSDRMCQTCVWNGLEALDSINTCFRNDELMMLPSYPNDRNGIISIESQIKDKPYININYNEIGLQSTKPMFIVLDSTGKIHARYIVSDALHVKAFLNYVYDRYFKAS